MRILGSFFVVLLIANTAFSATCPSGFNDVTSIYPETFYSKNGDFCPSGYEPYSAPPTLSFRFNGLILENPPTVCGSDAHYVSGECIPYAQENCPNDFYRVSENSATFYSKNGDYCPTGYEVYTYGDNMTFVFNGLILSNAPTVCASGRYVDGVCSSYDSTGCISGYVDIGVDSVVAAVDENGSCPTGYNSLWSYQECTASTTDSVCTTLCNGGMLQTAAGFCAASCGIGLSKLHIGDTLTFNLYGTRTTSPSVVIGNGNGVCYVNTAPGRVTGAMHIMFNGTVYHTTD